VYVLTVDLRAKVVEPIHVPLGSSPVVSRFPVRDQLLQIALIDTALPTRILR
jgi:hypothetical protein